MVGISDINLYAVIEIIQFINQIIQLFEMVQHGLMVYGGDNLIGGCGTNGCSVRDYGRS